MVEVDDLMNVYLVQWEKEDLQKTLKLKQLFRPIPGPNSNSNPNLNPNLNPNPNLNLNPSP